MAGYGLCTGGLSVFLGYGGGKGEFYEGDGDTALKLSANLSFRALTTSRSRDRKSVV